MRISHSWALLSRLRILRNSSPPERRKVAVLRTSPEGLIDQSLMVGLRCGPVVYRAYQLRFSVHNQSISCCGYRKSAASICGTDEVLSTCRKC